MECNIFKIVILTLAVIIITASSAMAINIQGQSVGVRVDNSTDRDEVVKAPHAPSVALVTSNRWPCGGYAGIGAQGQYAGVNLGGTKDSKNCIAWMLASQTTDPAKKEAYLCQMKVHRKAMKLNGTPCKKVRR